MRPTHAPAFWEKRWFFNAPLANVVDLSEYSALAARGLAHLCLNHGRRLGLLDGLSRANPP
jgi:hypothetical protein